MQQEIILKKNIIGGFNRKQVTQCLLHLKSEYTENLSAEEIADAKKTIENLTSILNDRTENILSLKDQLESLNYPDCEDRLTVAKSISEAEQNIENAKSSAESITRKTKDAIKSKEAQLETMLSKIHAINEETEKIKCRLTQILEKLSVIQIDTGTEENTGKPIIVHSEPIAETIITKIIPDAEAENVIESYEEDISVIFEDTQENINSIDNFFAELYKMTNGKLFEPRPLPKSDTDDDFEYEY